MKIFKNNFKTIIIITVAVFVVAALGILITLSFQRISFFAVQGASMDPTLKNGQGIVLKQEKNVKKGQIIVFKKPSKWDKYEDQDNNFIKRIIATPGDEISYKDNVLFVNDKPFYNLDKDAYKCEKGKENYTHVLKNNELFVMGDNRTNSLDSFRIFCDGDDNIMYIPVYSVIDYGYVIANF